MLVDRGECKFVQKALNAQNIGARLLIVVDDKEDDMDNIVMIDDGSAGNLYIPTLMIRKIDGSTIKDYLENEKPVALSVSFDIKDTTKQVKYDLWLSSANFKSYLSVKEIAQIANDFSKKEAVFTPHYGLRICYVCRSQNY